MSLTEVVLNAWNALGKLDAGLDPSELTPGEKLDISTHRAHQRPIWSIATVKTDYGSVIDFTKLSAEEKQVLLSDPTFADSVVHKTWSTHPGGVFLPCKRKREWTDKEAERLTIWKINREAEKAKRKAALADLYSVGGTAA